MSEEAKLENLGSDFEKQLGELEKLRTTVFGLLQNSLSDLEIDYLPIQSRIKDRNSFLNKVAQKEYSNPLEQMTDLVAFRVIVYLESDIGKVVSSARNLFEVDTQNSVDKLQSQEVNTVGYRSYHLVCSLGDTRKNLPEYNGLCDKKFELQIRTVLQHAWAEIEHKRNYKGQFSLPHPLQRRLMTAAGTIEMLDREFSAIAKEAAEYERRLLETSPELANDKLSSIALMAFYKKFLMSMGYENPSPTFGDEKTSDVILEEIKHFGIHDIKGLTELIRRVNVEAILEKGHELKILSSATAFYRNLMICDDAAKYFSKAHNGNFDLMSREMLDILSSISGNEKLRQLAMNAGVDLHELPEWIERA